MIPQGGVGNSQLNQAQQPSRTYRLDPITNRIVGNVDGLEAVKQAVYKVLQTERFEHLIYASNYGSELVSMIGQSSTFIQAELGRRIQQALLQDDRIKSVENFKVTVEGDSMLAEFTVVTSYGAFQTTKGVNSNV